MSPRIASVRLREAFAAPATFGRVSRWPRLRVTEKVAAVCYRFEHGKIEFLLVQTSSGRWTFPKGNVELGLTHAQSAAQEAREEAGVHGRIEELSFAQYVTKKGKNGAHFVTSAYLCEVLWLHEPLEERRNPTWFRAAKAKRRLQELRFPEDAAEHSRIVDAAERLLSRRPGSVDTLERGPKQKKK